ncbi:MAG: 30S ribosome-binding factor RbfA [Candidatus Abawacabacteria bacterium]|nr:30S ribosome-binding factor RbfA [Candidatus Abawacabacteria bacterium]
MAESRRLKQINQVLKEHIGQFLEREFHEPEIGLLTVTRVEVTPDLAEAKVWLSSYMSEKNPLVILKAVKRHAINLNKQLRRVLTTKNLPKLYFMIDENADYADKIDRLLKQALGPRAEGDQQ